MCAALPVELGFRCAVTKPPADKPAPSTIIQIPTAVFAAIKGAPALRNTMPAIIRGSGLRSDDTICDSLVNQRCISLLQNPGDKLDNRGGADSITKL